MLEIISRVPTCMNIIYFRAMKITYTLRVYYWSKALPKMSNTNKMGSFLDL